MKKILYPIMFLTFFSASAQTAQNISFTDLDGTTHDLYTYLDSGYTVILDFSYELCGPCYEWTIYIGHDLWEEHGPEGDNTLRMFHFDVYPETDESVESYAQEWGVEYSVTNLPDMNTFAEFPENGYPTIYVICPDKSYSETGGYGHPFSFLEAQYFLNQCNGIDLSTNVCFLESSEPSHLCDQEPLSFSPTLSLASYFDFGNSGSAFMDLNYPIEVFINGTLIDTQMIDPWSDGALSYDDSPTLSPIEVGLGDELMFVCHYPGDTYPNDDTVRTSIPSEVNTPTSTTTVLNINLGIDVFYNINSPGGQYIASGSTEPQIELDLDSCYQIQFVNAHVGGASVTDSNGVELLSFQAGEFGAGAFTPWLYFNIADMPVSLEQYQAHPSTPLSVHYFDLNGRLLSISKKSDLPQGVYIERLRYRDGTTHTKKRIKF